MMLFDGFRGFVGLGCWFMCVAIGQRLWRSLMVEGLLLSLLVDGGLFKLVLFGSVLMDGQFEGGKIQILAPGIVDEDAVLLEGEPRYGAEVIASGQGIHQPGGHGGQGQSEQIEPRQRGHG